jgi:hypothetical protein
LFTLGKYLKITDAAHIFGYFISQLSLSSNFIKKWVGLHFGSFFTQAHLVTLVFRVSGAKEAAS